MTIPALTLAERSVLITCTEAFARYASQPPEHLLDAANSLLNRGLLQKRAGWLDVLVTTTEGEIAYAAVRWSTCLTCGLEIVDSAVADRYEHADGQDHGHSAKPIP